MSRVPKSAYQVAFPIVKQPTWGTRLLNASLARYITLEEPLVIDAANEYYNDAGHVGKGHQWETGRGLLATHVKFEIPLQPMPLDWIAVFTGLFFSELSSAASGGAEGYTHTCKFIAPETRDSSYFTSLAILEDGTDYALVDIACTEMTLKGEGKERLQFGGSFVATKLEELSGYSFPAAATLYYAYNYAGLFEIADVSKRSQLAGFELKMSNGINMNLAWAKVAAEADRVYPQSWPFSPSRSVDLSVKMWAEEGDLTDFRASRDDFTKQKFEIECLGQIISSSEHRGALITVPQAVIDEVGQSYPEDLLQLDLKLAANYDATLAGPLSVAITTGDATYLATEA